MGKVRVPVYGTTGKAIFLNDDATVGATIGVDLYMPDGKTVVQAKDILNSYIQSNPSGATSSISTTDDLPEGSYNLYFTARRAQDAVAAILSNSTNITWTYVGGTSISANTPQNIRTIDTPTFAQVGLAADPTAALQAATKQYVDNAIAGLTWKTPVLAATTANITLSGPQTIDGISITAGTRVLVKDQTTQSQNGLYLCAAGAWTRTTDMNTWAQVPNAAVFVEEGTTNADKGYTCTADPGGTIGTTAITWVQFNGGGSSSPLTTKGDIYTRSTTADARLAVGADGTFLMADSTAPTGQSYRSIPGVSVSLLSTMMADSPLGLWPCSDASGGFADASGNGNNLAITGSVTYQNNFLIPTLPSTKFAVIGSMTGGNAVNAGRLTTNLGLTPPVVNWTAECAFYPYNVSTNGLAYRIFDFRSAAGSGPAMTLYWQSTNVNFGSFIFANSAGSNVFTVACWVVGKPIWLQVRCSTTGTTSTVNFYVNGLLLASATTAASTQTGTFTVNIGAVQTFGTSPFAVGFVGAYGTALAESRLVAHAQAAGMLCV